MPNTALLGTLKVQTLAFNWRRDPRPNTGDEPAADRHQLRNTLGSSYVLVIWVRKAGMWVVLAYLTGPASLHETCVERGDAYDWAVHLHRHAPREGGQA